MTWRMRVGIFAAGLLVALVAYECWVVIASLGPDLGSDYRIYMVIAGRVLNGGPLYMPYQTAGPYVTIPGDSMYPPITFPLFAAFYFLPAMLWWAIPLGLAAWALWSLRPSRPRLLLMFALLAWPGSVSVILLGNPGMWVFAALALGARYGWPAALVLLKPSLFPLALLGAGDKRWWVAVVGLCLASVATLPLTLDWLAAILNARGTWSGWLYSLPSVPLMLVPILASAHMPSLGLIRAGFITRRPLVSS